MTKKRKKKKSITSRAHGNEGKKKKKEPEETAIEFHAGQNYFCIHPGLLGIMASWAAEQGPPALSGVTAHWMN